MDAADASPQAPPAPKFLQDVWTYYFHDPDDANWTLESYVRLADASTIDDVWQLHRATAKFVSRGMFFVMREHVYPCWDDKHNIGGGCLSMKVLKEDLPAFWEHLLVHALGERLLIDRDEHNDAGADDDDAWSDVNGLSVSPKRVFCIVKIWLRTGRNADRRAFRMPPGYTGEVLYRSNADNIKGNNARCLLPAALTTRAGVPEPAD
jgi:hypothetical protein